jgi:excisionase family DNA binding protein
MDNPFEILIQQNTEILKQLQLLMSLGIIPPPVVTTHNIDQKLSLDELAEYLGKDKSTIHRYKKNGVFPAYQAGRTVFFKKSEVDEAMSSQSKTKKGVKAHG